jgi:hypothetical protein
MIDHLNLLRKKSINEKSLNLLNHLINIKESKKTTPPPPTSTTAANNPPPNSSVAHRHHHPFLSLSSSVTAAAVAFANHSHYQQSQQQQLANNEIYLCNNNANNNLVRIEQANELASSDHHNHSNQQQLPSLSNNKFNSTILNSLLDDHPFTLQSTIPTVTGAGSKLLNRKLNSQSIAAAGSEKRTRPITKKATSAATLGGSVPVKSNSITTILIDVYLLADCCYQELTSISGDNLIDLNHLIEQFNDRQEAIPFSFELLERWSISMITGKKLATHHIHTHSHTQTSLSLSLSMFA